MTRKTKRTDVIDQHIGNRIREQRENIGMTQGDLARAAGISYQQIHKYEQGMNRISAGRLRHIAQILAMPVTVFYDGAEQREISPEKTDTSYGRMCLEMARNFRQIANPRHQEALTMLTRILAE